MLKKFKILRKIPRSGRTILIKWLHSGITVLLVFRFRGSGIFSDSCLPFPPAHCPQNHRAKHGRRLLSSPFVLPPLLKPHLHTYMQLGPPTASSLIVHETQLLTPCPAHCRTGATSLAYVPVIAHARLSAGNPFHPHLAQPANISNATFSKKAD